MTQSVVGDCSFLCALVVAVNFEKKHKCNIITEIIYPQSGNGVPQYNPDGLYLIKLHWNGKTQPEHTQKSQLLTVLGVYRQILIDDWFPVGPKNSYLFAHSNNYRELWVSILGILKWQSYLRMH